MVRLGIRIRSRQGHCRRWSSGYRGRQAQSLQVVDWAVVREQAQEEVSLRQQARELVREPLQESRHPWPYPAWDLA